MTNKITECPHCGSEEYYVELDMIFRGWRTKRYDGGVADKNHDGEAADALNHTLDKELKTVFCYGCDARLGTKKSLGLNDEE